MTLSKPRPTGNEVVDKWHLECWEAEKAFRDATDAYDNCPSNAPAKKRSKALEALQSAARRLTTVYGNLPLSDPEDTKTSHEVLESIGTLTLEQAARCINKYLEAHASWDVSNYTERLDYHEWSVNYIWSSDSIYTQNLGKVYITEVDEPQKNEPDRKSLRLGYSIPKDEDWFPAFNEHLADMWRGCCYACADLADKLADARASEGSLFANRDKVKENWTKIPNNGNDMQIVKRWNDGESAKRIAVFFKYKSESHVENRIRALRKEFPDLVLTSKARQQYGIPRKL